MRFEEVLPMMRDGVPARRASWDDPNAFYCVANGEFVDAHKYKYGPTADDLIADDWVIVKNIPTPVQLVSNWIETADDLDAESSKASRAAADAYRECARQLSYTITASAPQPSPERS